LNIGRRSGWNMDLADRIATGRRGDGAWIVPLGTAVPDAPPSLAEVRVEVRAVGNTLLSVASVSESGPRPPAFWRALGEEIHAFVGTLPCAAELAIVGHALRGLAAHPARDRIERRVFDILERRSVPQQPSPISLLTSPAQGSALSVDG
jgi:hypothetical protein